MALALVPIPFAVISIISSALLIRMQYRALYGRLCDKTSEDDQCQCFPRIRSAALGDGSGGTERASTSVEVDNAPFRRIILIMSAYDVLNSITVACGPFVMPKDSSPRIWASGNDQTCAAWGFFFQFNYPSLMYYGVLSFYFLTRIRFNMKDSYFGRRIEPILHVFVIGFTAITASIGAGLHFYGEIFPGPACWLAPQPYCDESCVERLEWVFGGWVVILVWLFLIVNNIYIFFYVRNTIRRSQRRRSSLTMESQEARIRAVAIQAFLYVVVFMMTYIWTIILRLSDNDSTDGKELEARLFPVMMLRAVFLPLMGFGNLLVYSRPRYYQKRAKCPDLSRWGVIRSVLLEETAEDSNLKSSRGRDSGSNLPPGDQG